MKKEKIAGDEVEFQAMFIRSAATHSYLITNK